MGVVADLFTKIGLIEEKPLIVPQTPDPVLFLSDFDHGSILNVAYPDGAMICLHVTKSVAHRIGNVERGLNPPTEANREDRIHLTQTALASLHSIEEDFGEEINQQLALYEEQLITQLNELLGLKALD